MRLAAAYRLPHISVKDLLAAQSKLTPEEQKAVAAELSGKDPRASLKSLASLLRIVVSENKAAANRG